MYTTYYTDGDILIETLFPLESTGPIWVGIIDTIKEEAASIKSDFLIGSSPNPAIMNNERQRIKNWLDHFLIGISEKPAIIDNKRQRIQNWLDHVNIVDILFGVLVPSVVVNRQELQKAIGYLPPQRRQSL